MRRRPTQTPSQEAEKGKEERERRYVVSGDRGMAAANSWHHGHEIERDKVQSRAAPAFTFRRTAGLTSPGSPFNHTMPRYHELTFKPGVQSSDGTPRINTGTAVRNEIHIAIVLTE